MVGFLLGTAIIVAIFELAEALHSLGLPIPSGVLGMILLFCGLQFGVVKLKWLERAAGFLLRHMVLLFVPLTVGLMDMGVLLSRQFWIICTSLVVSFLAVLYVTGLLGNRLFAMEEQETEA